MTLMASDMRSFEKEDDEEAEAEEEEAEDDVVDDEGNTLGMTAWSVRPGNAHNSPGSGFT